MRYGKCLALDLALIGSMRRGSNFKIICSELNSIGSISAPLICCDLVKVPQLCCICLKYKQGNNST